MEPSCVRQNLIPGTSKLFADFLYHFDRVSSFYTHDFADPASFQRAAAEIAYPDSRRQALVAALRDQNGPSAALDELAKPETVAVVTGQQVGLLSGPSYTIFKALTAVKLAQELGNQGIRAVPIFWLASEDHDLAEVDHAWLFDQDVKPSKISVANETSGGGPVGEVPLNDLPFSKIRESLGNLPFAEEVIERLQQAYANGATFASAFRAFLQDILGGFGILFLDPLAPKIREMAAPFLADTAGCVPELLAGLKVRDRELAQSGYHSQVHLEDNSSLLFLLEEKRAPLRWKNGQFASRDKAYGPDELKSFAKKLSPNALLRPVMQDYLLPTISYVGGPAEIAYMAQGQVLYQKLLGRMPVIFPRNSFTLLDAHADKLIKRYALTMTDLLDHQERVKSKIAKKLVPQGLLDQFGSLETSISGAIDGLASSLQNFDPTLQPAAQKSGAKMLYQLRRLREKATRETLRRDERSTRDANYLIDLIYPHRRPQERFYSIVPFLAKHGLDLPERLFAMTQVTCPDHMVRTL